MVRLYASACIEAPAATVWEHLARLEDIQLWSEQVVRARCDRERAPEAVRADPKLGEREDRVREALAAGAATLSEVVGRVLPWVPEADQFVSVGRIAAQVAAEGQPRSARERPWVGVPGEVAINVGRDSAFAGPSIDLRIEEWSLSR